MDTLMSIVGPYQSVLLYSHNTNDDCNCIAGNMTVSRARWSMTSQFKVGKLDLLH